MRIRWQLEYLVFRGLACLVGTLSARMTAAVAHTLAWIVTRLLPRRLSRHDVAHENLRAAYGDSATDGQLDEIIFEMWVHLFRLVAEMIQFPRKLRLENCREVIAFRNRPAAMRALGTGRTLLVLGGHFGNWEATTSLFGVFGFPMGVVARALDNPFLHRWFVESREKTGHRLLLKQGGWDGMVDILNAGGNLGLLCDQDAGPRGVFVDFFGRPASTFKSLALMAREYNALLVVGYGIRLPDDFASARWVRFEVGCEAVIDPATIQADDEVRVLTELYTQALEQAIRRAPEQYFWVHRRWKSVPRQRQRAAERKAA